MFKNNGLKISVLSSFFICFLALNLFSQTAAPVVINPRGGDQVKSGKSYNIEWAGIRGSKVNINLIGQNGLSRKIARDVDNTGFFEWNVSCSLQGEGFIIWVMSCENLIIELWQGKYFKTRIIRSTPNTNSYEWHVASDLQGDGFQIKIKSPARANELAFSENFKILN